MEKGELEQFLGLSPGNNVNSVKMKGKVTAEGTMMNEGQGDSFVESLTDPMTNTPAVKPIFIDLLRRLKIQTLAGVR